MPDEERLRTKRRKLDSIITKLHQVTPLGSESLEEEENVNEEVKGNVDKGDESLPGSSRRKREKRHVAVDVTKSQATENGTEMECEQEVPCNGEGDTNDETHPAVVKQERGSESYANSLEGFQQMLGYSISEEVVTQKAEGGEKKKRLLSESSDADGHELPRRVECTACSRNVNPAHGTICRHPCLNVLICKKCNQYYNSGPFTRDEFGIDEQCRWCGDGGSLLCCDKCDKAFCKPCIKRNFGKSTLKKIVNAPEGTEWLCFCCNPKPLSKLVKVCNRIMNILQTRKAQKTIFKTKKGGPSLSDTPNQKERRNRLSSLTENLGMSSDGALSPNESPAKKHMPDAEEDDSVTKQSSKKSRTRSRDKEHNKQNGSSKKNVLIIDDDSDSDNAVQSVKVSKGKTVKVESDRKTKRKLEISAESKDEKSKKGSKTSQAKKSRTRKYSSHDSDSDVEKQNYKSKPTSKTRSKQVVAAQSSEEDDDSSDIIYSDDSDSDSDFVSMVKKKDSKSHKNEKTKKKAVLDSEVDEEEDRKTRTSNKTREAKKDNKKQRKGKKQAVSDSEEDEEEESEKDRKTEKSKRFREVKKDNKKQKKGKTKNRAVSDSEEEEESEEDGKRKRKRKRSVTQKQTRKRPRKVTSSEDESKSSEDQSDSDGPLTRNKKKQPQRQRKKKKVASDSDEDSEEIGGKKKRKTRRKGKKSSSESEEDTRRSKRKGKGKGKGKQKSKKKHYIKKDSDESEDEVDEEDEDVSPSKRKGRKKIRKLITDEKLAVETRKARRLEEERRKRLLERTQNNEDDMPGESAKVTGLVLESDPSTKEPIVDVKEDLLQYFKPHQCKGIQFMYNCVIESVKAWNKEEPGSGCLLAHCMGLGKTLQVVALVHTLMTHKDINLQRVLVVAPLNTVLNWQVEFDKWLSVDDRLEVLILQEVGGDNWRRMDMLKHWLRYGGVLIMGYSMYRNLSQCYRIKSHTQKKIFKEALVDPGPELVVCDEGHILRNDGSAISKALNSIKTKRRIVLTGTPLQNNLIEYHCMVSFVKPSLLGTRKEFTNTFVNPIENGQCADSTAMDVQIMKQRCHVLHKMLQGCVQRRDYAVLIPFLPRKHEYVIKVRLSVLQRKLYQHFLSTFVFPEGTFGKKGVSLFSDYQALMRIWTHPWCLKLQALRRPETFVETDSMDDFVVHTDEEEEEEEVESESEKSTTSAEEEAQSSSESENERRRKKQGGRRGKKDSSSDKDNNINDSEGTSEEEVLPQSSRRRAAATPSTQSSSNKASTSTVNIDGEDITVVAINDGASTSQGNRRDKQAHKSKKIAKEEDGKAMIKNNGRQSRNSLNNSNNNSDLESAVGSTRSGTNFKDFEVEKEWYDEFLAEGDEFNVQLSGKLFLLMEILADAEAVGDKVLVFSQSLVTLDLIEKVLGGGDIGGDRENWCRGCDYFRMDGSTSAAMRQRWADIFNDEDNKNGRLFLISTKAGGLGINLVAANRVIVFDVSWNPSHDVQSIFRVYRFGQTKAVYVYRLIAQGTMEEKIYDRQVTKLSMSGRVVDEQQIERHFTAADLRELYTFNPDVLEEDKETEAGEEGAENDTGAGNGMEAANGTEAVKEMEIGNGTEAGKDTEAGDGTEAGNETEAVKETEAGKVTGVGNETEAGKKTEVLNETKAGKETEVVNEMEAENKTGAGNETEAGKKTEVVSETEAGKETGVVNETEAGKKTEVVSETEAGKETGVVSETEAGKKMEVVSETEAGKETGAGNETEAGKQTEAGKESEAEVGKETNSGAANKANTGKEDGAAKETTEHPTMPLPKDAVLADLINRLHPKWIVKYHEHDSLLQNIESEELTEEEMKAAWTAYEADKSGQAAPANARAMDPLQGHAQTQQQVVERIRLNTEMLQQIQLIRQQQEVQQRREIEERMRQVNQQRQQLYQQHRDSLLQQHHQRQQDEMRRQNQMRFIQQMTQPRPGQPLQPGQNTINVQTQLPSTAAAPRPPPPTYLRFQLPPSIRLAAPPVGATPSAGTPPTIDLSLGPRSTVGALPNSNPQLIRQPQNAAPK